VSLSQTIEQWFSEAQAVAQLVARWLPSWGLSPWGSCTWGPHFQLSANGSRQPRAANQVVMGLLFVIAASTVASLISF